VRRVGRPPLETTILDINAYLVIYHLVHGLYPHASNISIRVELSHS